MFNNQINRVAMNTPLYLPEIKKTPAVTPNLLVKEPSVNVVTLPLIDSFVVDAQIPTAPSQVRSGRDYKLKGVRGFFALLSTAVLATGAVFAHFKQQSTTSLKKEVVTVLPKPVLNPEMVVAATKSIGCGVFTNDANTGKISSLVVNTAQGIVPIDPFRGHIPLSHPALIVANKTYCTKRLATITESLMQTGSALIPQPSDRQGNPTLKLELIPQPRGEAKVRLSEKGKTEVLPPLVPIKKEPDTISL